LIDLVSFYLSNLQGNEDELHLHSYDSHLIGKDSIGEAKINLKEHVFGQGTYDGWAELKGHMHLRNHGEIHVTIEHQVSYLPFSYFLKSDHDVYSVF
jgi:hypothetical protein